MDAAIDLSDASKALDLSNIRFQLIRLEDTILYSLIERVQFPLNPTIYTPLAIQIPSSSLSLLDWLLSSRETLDSLIRRYQSPDEYPFFPSSISTPILKPLSYPKILHHNTVNVNERIKSYYIREFLPRACYKKSPGGGGKEGDRGETEENYGSAATCDIACLQALSRRIHFGKFVAEVKFRDDPKGFEKMIRDGDREGIEKAITDEAVERKVLERLRLKALAYGTDPSELVNEKMGGNGRSAAAEARSKINVEEVVGMYRDIVIPLTKVVEVEYLVQRLVPEEEVQNGT